MNLMIVLGYLADSFSESAVSPQQINGSYHALTSRTNVLKRICCQLYFCMQWPMLQVTYVHGRSAELPVPVETSVCRINCNIKFSLKWPLCLIRTFVYEHLQDTSLATPPSCICNQHIYTCMHRDLHHFIKVHIYIVEKGATHLYTELLLLCWKAFLENTTAHQQHWANSVQTSPSNHLCAIAWQPPKHSDAKSHHCSKCRGIFLQV